MPAQIIIYQQTLYITDKQQNKIFKTTSKRPNITQPKQQFCETINTYNKIVSVLNSVIAFKTTLNLQHYKLFPNLLNYSPPVYSAIVAIL